MSRQQRRNDDDDYDDDDQERRPRRRRPSHRKVTIEKVDKTKDSPFSKGFGVTFGCIVAFLVIPVFFLVLCLGVGGCESFHRSRSHDFDPPVPVRR